MSAQAPSEMEAVKEAIRRAALDLSFVRLGFTSAAPFPEAERAWRSWIEQGCQAGMAFLEKPRADPGALLPSAKSILVAALPYERSTSGPVASYARGADYHYVVGQMLEELARLLPDLVGRPVDARACVDTAPLFERAAAERAGVAFIGKSCMAIIPGHGSAFVLGELITDLAFDPDEPATPRCGRCTACLDACPTGALVAPYRLDSRRCLSYLTIESRASWPRELRPLAGETLFGCDRCQQACPYNARPGPASLGLAASDRLRSPAAAAWAELTSSGYRRLVAGTPLRRASRRQLMRNAVVALGNSGGPEAETVLVRVLRREESALVREHAAWALGRLRSAGAQAELERVRREDPDASVRAEAEAALA